MLKIIICDDDDFTVKLIHRLLEKAIEISKIEAQIVCKASSGADILNFVRKNTGPYLYFIDFDFGKKELNGIDLAKKIYQYDANGKIVFVTSHGDKGMAILQSGVQAFGFIEKDPGQQVMIASLIRYLKMAAPALCWSCRLELMKQSAWLYLILFMWIPSKQLPTLFAIILSTVLKLR